MIVSIGVIAGLLAGALAADGGPAPSFTSLADRIAAATAPSHGYTVDVQQTVRPGQAGGKAASPQPTDVTGSKTQFKMSWDPARGMAMQKPANPQTGEGPSKEAEPPGMRLSIDVAGFLKQMRTWPDVQVADDVENGSRCYRVTGKDRQDTGCVLWVDAEHSYVSKLALTVRGQHFAVVTFECGLVNGQYWLPERATIVHQDGTEVIQEFGPYHLEGGAQ